MQHIVHKQASSSFRDSSSYPLTKTGEDDDLARWDAFELESLALNLDAALRVHERHQFFGWTQGTLQSLVEHDVLICALQNAKFGTLYVDSFSAITLEPSALSEMFRQDVTLVPHLIRLWEENHCRQVSCEIGASAGAAPPFPASALARELLAKGVRQVIGHGTHDAAGQLNSFFIFACRGHTVSRRKAYLVELIVPYLHTAWMRTQTDWMAERPGMKTEASSLLTAREREILSWVYRGKSNIEIGLILQISPLTVKNHVQKILRRLNVLNRTQAVGKALALRILTP